MYAMRIVVQMLFWNRWNQESAGRVYFNISRQKPAHTPDTLHVQPLSCKLEWTNQKHFYCFFLKPVRDNLAPGFPRALDLSLLHAQKSSGSRLLLTKTNKLRLSCQKIGKFETLKGFGGLKIYLQAWEIISFKQQKENQLVITKKNKEPIYNQKLTEIVVGEWVQ